MTDWVTIKLRREDRDAAQDLVRAVARDGWNALDLRRDDTPTLGAVIGEAVAALAARLGRKKDRP